MSRLSQKIEFLQRVEQDIPEVLERALALYFAETIHEQLVEGCQRCRAVQALCEEYEIDSAAVVDQGLQLRERKGN